MGLFDLFRRKPPKLTPRDHFANELLERARRLPEVTSAQRLTDSFGLVVHLAGDELHLYLDNVFAETRDVDPSERERIVGLFFKSLLLPREKSMPWEVARPRLRAVLRAPFSAELELEPEASKRLVQRELLPAVRESLVLDEEASMSYVLQEELTAWGVSADEALAIARENLGTLAGEGVALYDAKPSPIFHVDTGDDYESARVLVPGFLASFRQKVEGEPIFIMPSRSLLFVAGDDNPETVRRLCDLAEREYAAGARSISSAVYTLDANDRPIPYLPPGSTDAAVLARTAHARFLASEYEAQRQDLDRLYAERDIDLFVAPVSGLRSQSSGEVVTWATFAIGVDSLLPDSDYLVVGSPEEDQKPLFVPFAVAKQIAAEFLTREPRMFPVRWRTATRIPQEIVAALQAAAIRL